ncbi:MAG: Outer membrane protein assembly factor BamB [Alphaproteobacteria bacterium MarineAlpha3_Bin5]|nr:pyrrolo-quinoline quinone [Magnetovibrio sp.]PPR77766.1 MAG: Outer membrane protein assembly factor BamB [Alphaproteobacteria bacterium MarineAlpha3_Bin5]
MTVKKKLITNQVHAAFKTLAVLLLQFFLFGCEIPELDFLNEIGEERLKGKRISVLSHYSELTPDEEASKEPILLPAPSPNEDWPVAGGYPNHAMHHMEIRDAITEYWSVDIGAGAESEARFISAPVVAKGSIYAMDTLSAVSAYNTRNGERIWKIHLEPDYDEGHIGGGIAYGNQVIFVATGFAEVIALNAKTGKVFWRQSVNSPMRASPVVRGGRVFVVTVDNKLFALNGNNGEILWTHNGVAESASLLGGASPAVGSGTVVVAYSSGELFALKVETGRVLWQDSLSSLRRTDSVSSLSHIRGRPIIDRGKVFAVSHNGLMVCIDLRNGQRIWESKIGSAASPWVAGNYLFLITNDMEIAAINRERGTIIWVRGLPRFENPRSRTDPIIWTGPVLASDRLIAAGSHGYALAISPYSGQILGRVDLPDGVDVPPVIAQGNVYFLANDAELVAYR